MLCTNHNLAMLWKKKFIKFAVYSIIGMSLEGREWVAIIYKVEKSMHGVWDFV